MLRRILMGWLAVAMILTSGVMALARTAPDGQTIVICTGAGLATVTIDANGEPVAPAPFCPDCLMHAQAVLPGAPVLHAPAHLINLRLADRGARHALSVVAVQPAARGPPVGV